MDSSNDDGTNEENDGSLFCYVCEEDGREEKLANVTEKGYPWKR